MRLRCDYLGEFLEWTDEITNEDVLGRIERELVELMKGRN